MYLLRGVLLGSATIGGVFLGHLAHNLERYLPVNQHDIECK